MIDRTSASRALQALTAAALALPGLTAANAEDGPVFNVQYGHYWEGERDLDGQKYSTLNLKPLEVDSFAVNGLVPLSDGWSVKGNFSQDSWSGATPVVSLPSAAVQAQLMSGASSPNFYDIDRNGTPVVVDFNDYDPDTDTYAFKPHPGLVHILASASPETRRQWDGAVTHRWNRAELSVGGGISDEHDYLSKFVNLGGTFDFDNKLTVLNWGASATHNRIRASLAANSAAYTGNYDDQIQDYNGQPTIFGKRQDYAANIGVTQILNAGALVQADIGYTRSTGFLENPYKAVVFAFNDPDEPFDNSGLKYIPIKGLLEQRPDARNQWAFNLRYTQHIAASDAGLHLNYRFYTDDWGIRAHTLEASVDQPLGGGWMITPDVRYYTQTAAHFYAPFFLLDEAYPFHPGGGLSPNDSPVPLQYFSSDERLSAFGTLGGSLALQKSLGHGIALDLSYEYYTHKGSLKLGGGGEPSYANFHSSLVSAGLSLDLARRQDELASGVNGDGADRLNPFLTVRPAGLLLPEVMRAGSFALSAGFSATNLKGPVELHNEAVGNDDLIANACGETPCTLGPIDGGRDVVELALSYALMPNATITVAPHYVENSLTLVDIFPDFFAGPLPPLGGPSGSGPHSKSGWGDTTVLGSFDLTPNSPAHVRIGAGLSLPTGKAGLQLNGKPDYASYSLQTGSGTWDAIGVLDVEGSSGPLSAGAEVSGVKRLGTNSFGYRLGDKLRADLWAGTRLTNWIGVSGRLRADKLGGIHGGFNDHIENIGGEEVSVPQPIASPDDLAANHGGTFVDAGPSLTLNAPSGPFKGDRLTVEWLEPISTKANGYQLRRGGTVNARVTIGI